MARCSPLVTRSTRSGGGRVPLREVTTDTQTQHKKEQEPGMSKSRSANPNPRNQSRLVLLMAGGLVAGCGGSDPWSIDPQGYDGISEETFPLLTNSCTINNSTSKMTLSPRGGETVYVTLRAADGLVIADGQTGG